MGKYLALIFFSFIIIISGCSSKTSSSRKPVISIQVSPSTQNFIWGDKFTINLASKVKNMKIKKIDLFINNILVRSLNESKLSYSVNSGDYLPGNLNIRVESINGDGIKGTNYSDILVVSDINPEKLSYQVVETLNHNTRNFTEGLEFFDDKLFESTGNHGESYIYSYNPNTGKIFNSIKLDNQYFGEGITILQDKIYQLTYKAKKGFIYDVNSFYKVGEFSFLSDEGWGLTNDGKNLIMSDGTSKVHFIDPNSFKRLKSIEISDNKGIIENINELEYVDGFLYSNIWMTQTILKIDSNTGRVLAYINMSGLSNQFKNSNIDVFNGIAYNKKEKLFYVTGKYWPKIFKVRIN